MKKILMLLAFCLTLLVGQAQQQKDYPFYADGVVEFGYLVDEEVYYIVYRDTTNFPDFLVEDYFDDEDWYEEMYISLECEEDIFFEYLFWFAQEKRVKTKAFYNEDPRYKIQETETEVEGGPNYRYRLIKK